MSSDDESHPIVKHQQLTSTDFESIWALVCSFLAMSAIGHVQYTWTLFVGPLEEALDASTAEVQVAFSVFVALQTGSVLGLGALVPTHLHHRAMIVGSLCLLQALLGLSVTQSLPVLHAWAALMGVGVGLVYNFCMAVSVRCVPQHRGLAAGITAAGYGSGTLLTIGTIEHSIVRDGFRPVARQLGALISVVVLLSAVVMPASQRGTPKAAAPSSSNHKASDERELMLGEAIREASFWVLYLMLVIISTIGLVVTAQLAPIARSFNLSPSTLVLALQVDRVLNGLSRPLWGGLSDVIGRERALGFALLLQALVLVGWSLSLPFPSAFVVCSALSTFAWGEVYSLFPALAADFYGTQHISQTYGALYTGKAVASVLAGPIASMASKLFNWGAILRLLSASSTLDAYLALAVLGKLKAT